MKLCCAFMVDNYVCVAGALMRLLIRRCRTLYPSVRE
jgi:hypothetical protein